MAYNNQIAVVRSLECCHCKVADSVSLAKALQWVIDHHAEHAITTVNLAPADLKKEGPGFDLPIAISLIAHRSRIPIPVLSETAMIGELALNGELRPVRGLLAVPTLEGVSA